MSSEAKRDNGGRFRPGNTGNPKGRPKARPGVDAAVTKALSEKITVTEQGQRKRRSKLDITAAQVANKGASGDLRAAKMAFDLARKVEERAEAQSSNTPVMSQADREIADRVIARLRQILSEETSHDHSEP